MSIPEKITVAAIVKTKAETPEGHTIELEIETFKSQYPTKITRVPASLAAQFKAGAAVNVNLIRQALKKRQDGSPKSGEYYSDYYWGLEGIASSPPATPPVPTPPPVTATATGSTQAYNRTDPQTQLRVAELNKASIQAQVALKELGECVRVDIAPPQFRVVYWRTIGQWLGCDMTWDDLESASAPNPSFPAENVLPAAKEAAKLATVEQLDAFYTYTGRQPEKVEQFNAWLSRKFGRAIKPDFGDVTEVEAEEVLNVIKTAAKAGKVQK